MKFKLVILGVMLFIASGAWAGTEKVLYAFSGSDGAQPLGRPVLDLSGNLYGTTAGGGNCGDGTVFELSSDGKETVLYNFCGSDGSAPFGDLIRDFSGTLYGTTLKGGSDDCGTVWKLSGTTLTTLHSFTCSDGSFITHGVVRDSKGNIYGTANEGGLYGFGSAFEISSSGTFSVLYNFCLDQCTGVDGAYPSGLALGAAGNIFGTTEGGGDLSCHITSGPLGCGTVFELSMSNGKWEETILHRFKKYEGALPVGAPTVMVRRVGGKKLNVLFGTTLGGGTSFGGFGAAFEMIQSASGYSFQKIYTFTVSDGEYPQCKLTLRKGILYGTTRESRMGQGTVFKLTNTGTSWTNTVLYTFPGRKNGKNPVSGVAVDPNGDLYGVTEFGGSHNMGVLYEVTP
jgi:uncharacterized repeat protein (TIGR03803 family)